jgi:hypothetical protein
MHTGDTVDLMLVGHKDSIIRSSAYACMQLFCVVMMACICKKKSDNPEISKTLTSA